MGYCFKAIKGPEGPESKGPKAIKGPEGPESKGPKDEDKTKVYIWKF